MNKKTIAMPDGRYLIYYTFDDDEARQDSAPDAGAEQSEDKKDV